MCRSRLHSQVHRALLYGFLLALYFRTLNLYFDALKSMQPPSTVLYFIYLMASPFRPRGSTSPIVQVLVPTVFVELNIDKFFDADHSRR